MTRSASLSVEDISFRYGVAPVLKGTKFRLAAGEMAALLGRNGSGKSTLLNLIAAVLRPGAGRILLDGADLGRIPPRERARRIAMVPQTLPAPFGFTVREVVSLGRTPYLDPFRGERQSDREAVTAALRAAEIEALADRRVGAVSGGERQRTALALALAQEPALLLLDEPTAHLDMHHQMALLGRMKELNRAEGLTVLAAIHDVNLAALWFDRLLFLDEGRIAADGAPNEVLREELLERVFHCPVKVLEHPTEDVPLVALERT